MVSAGAAGCALAQTLIENRKHVLLLERGGEPNSNSRQKETAFDGLVDNDCIEVFDGNGVVLATGNCLGGATTYNQGVWIEDSPDFLSELGPLFSAEAVEQAYTWVRAASFFMSNRNPIQYLHTFSRRCACTVPPWPCR